MTNICQRNICIKYKISKGKMGSAMYKDNTRYCSICQVFMSWDGYRCPCCGTSMRTGPKSKKYRMEFPRIG